MPLAKLEIRDFRNLARAELDCAAGLNLIVGANASGKTSLLEAIYFLGRGRSFRTRQARELLRHGAEALQVVAILGDTPTGRRSIVGVAHDGSTLTARIDGAPVRTLADLAERMPVLLLNPDSHRLLDDGPRQRRRFMDWGVFHGKSGFLAAWKRYYAALRQRNSALRSGYDARSLGGWDRELAGSAERLDRLRGQFCQSLEAVLQPLGKQLLGLQRIELDYQRGWSRERELSELLRRELDADRRQGHTRRGPHRADFALRLDGQPAALRLSRGQQKLLVIVLILAQARLYRERREQPCILLIDDLPAELDVDNRHRVMRCLAGLDIQLFVTAIESGLLDTGLWSAARSYRIADGRLAEMV